MRLGLYTFASLAFIGLVAGLVYTLAPGSYHPDIPGLEFSLPIALWVVLPLLMLLLLTILHMLYHGTRSYFARRKWQRDAKTLQEAMYWSLIGEPKAQAYTIDTMREGATVLGNASLSLQALPEGASGKLAQTAEWIKRIQNGEYVDLKAKKVEQFMSTDNPLRVQNQCNRLAEDPGFADVILHARDHYAPACGEAALQVALKKDTFSKLSKFADQMHFGDIEVLLDRADAGEEVEWTMENMKLFIGHLELDCGQYMRLVSSAIKAFGPDENLKLFRSFAEEHPKAESAYLFLLFRYEMIDKAKEFLEEHEENEFVAFRAFHTLKKNKYNYKVRDFITAENACK
jgi:hypothetical protein